MSSRGWVVAVIGGLGSAAAFAACVSDNGTPVVIAGADGASDEAAATPSDAGSADGSTTPSDGAATSDTGVDAGVDAGIGDVDGVVVDAYGFLVSGASVRIGSTVVVTMGDGAFHFAAVPATYELDVVAPVVSNNVQQKAAAVYIGATARFAEIIVPPDVTTAQSATLSGNFANLTLPLAANQSVGLALYMPNGLTATGFQSVTPTAMATFSGATPFWVGGTKFNGTLDAIVYTQPASESTAFAGVASQNFNTSNGANSTGNTITLTTATTGTLTGTAVGATTGKVGITGYFSTVASPVGMAIPGGQRDTTDAGVFSIATPNATGVKLAIEAATSKVVAGGSEFYWVWKSNLAANATGVTLTFPASAPTAISPGTGATGVTNATTFSWKPVAGSSTYNFLLKCGAPTETYQMNIYTTATSLKLPDVSAMGLSLPTGTSCDWSVTAQPGTTVDDYAKQGGTAAHQNPGVIDSAYVSAPAVTITTQ